MVRKKKVKLKGKLIFILLFIAFIILIIALPKQPPSCGNSICERGEEPWSCPEDCEGCGDYVCGRGETFLNCPLDCPPPLSQMTSPELLNEAMTNAIESPEKSESICSFITDTEYADICFDNLADISNKISLCHKIQEVERRDRCYMQRMVVNKDFTICEKIVDELLNRGCVAFRNLREQEEIS